MSEGRLSTGPTTGDGAELPTDAGPLASVVIPTLQEGGYLRATLASLAEQTYRRHEVLVVDGGSHDDTVAIAREFGVRVVQAPGSTLVTARQLGAQAAGGSIVVSADADTRYPPDHLARVVAAFRADPHLVALGGVADFEPDPWWCRRIWSLTWALYAWIYRRTGRVVYVAALNLAYTRAAFERCGGYTLYHEAGGDEIDILRKLRRVGRVALDADLVAFPSSRRARTGFVSYYVRHGIIGYSVAYLLARRFRRVVLKYAVVR